MIKIITDSTADVPADLVARHGIGVIPAILEIEGRTFYDNVTLTRADFYRDLDGYKAFPKTAAASAGSFADLYRATAAGAGQEGCEIISIHLAPQFSGMIRAAQIAADDVRAEGIQVRVVDSGALSLGVGFQVLAAAELAHTGASVDEISAALERMRPNVHLLVMFDTLKNLRKGGRVSALTAGIGDLLQLKLLVEVRDAAFHPLDKVRTRGRGLETLIARARGHGPAARLAVLHAGDVGADLMRVREALADLVPLADQLVIETGPALGAHTGTRAIGIALQSI